MRQLIAGFAVLAMACAGSETAGNANAAEQSSAAGEEPQAEVQSSEVHEVMMELVDGSYIYTPLSLTIRVGDTVRWINASGGPHNVAFYADQIPEGAEDPLNAAMSNRLGNLNGELLVAPDAVYEIVFAGTPVGDYGYFCLPHEALGMIASLTIEQ